MASETVIIPDADLYANAERAIGQVVLITGGAIGLGKTAALEFGKRGSKIVIGDINSKDGEETAQEIRAAGGSAIFRKCDVTKWDDLVSLFESAWSSFGSIDVVLANAGINECQDFMSVALDDEGKPKRPNLKTIEINLISVVNTAHLAVHYFTRNQKKDSLKALVITGSIASFHGLPGGPQYSSAKHAVLGFMRGLRWPFLGNNLRIALVAPWFVDTALLTTANKVLTSGLPKTPASRVAGALFLAATDNDPESNGASYTLPDDREVIRIHHTQLTEGAYKLLDARVERIVGFQKNLKVYVGVVKTILGLQGTKILGLLGVCFAASRLAIAAGWV